MTSPPPIPCMFDGEVFRPMKGHLPRIREHFGAGEIVTLIAHEDRSSASHRHFFAAINEAWANLPEDVAANFASAEALRKWALIKAGYRDERTIVCGSKAEAQRVAAFVKPMDEHAVVSVSGAAVVVLTAKSQSMRAMGRADFQASKDAVMEILAELVAVDASTLKARAEAA